MEALKKHSLLFFFLIWYLIGQIFKFLLLYGQLCNLPIFFLICIWTLFIVVLILFYVYKVDSTAFSLKNYRQVQLLFKSCLLCVCLYIISGPIHYILAHFRDPANELLFNLGFNPASLLSTDSNVIYWIFKSIIVAPVLEEILFRGFLQKYLYRLKKPFVAILVAALLFSLSHYEINKIFTTFLGGLLYGFIYYKSGSLLIAIICHSLHNLLCDLLPSTNGHISPYLIGIYILAVPIWVLLITNIRKTQPILANTNNIE
ncbi:MAG: lysostaphin resistance A-like protein [Bacteroidales bacterium]